MYYALTLEGHTRVEDGLTGGNPMYMVLGALADLEEREPLKTHRAPEISKLWPDAPKGFLVPGLREARARGFVESVEYGNERFEWD